MGSGYPKRHAFMLVRLRNGCLRLEKRLDKKRSVALGLFFSNHDLRFFVKPETALNFIGVVVGGD